jgi:hypothetical protein
MSLHHAVVAVSTRSSTCRAHGLAQSPPAGIFEDTLRSMPFGPVLVTLRLERTEANPHGISAYVNGRQMGWLGTDWTANDPQVKWIKRLDAAGILPRFQGLHRLTENAREHIINFDFPGRHDDPLDDIARRIIGEVSGSV